MSQFFINNDPPTKITSYKISNIFPIQEMYIFIQFTLITLSFTFKNKKNDPKSREFNGKSRIHVKLSFLSWHFSKRSKLMKQRWDVSCKSLYMSYYCKWLAMMLKLYLGSTMIYKLSRIYIWIFIFRQFVMPVNQPI